MFISAQMFSCVLLNVHFYCFTCVVV